MDNRFKWNMFMTSFLPLWITIVVSNIWNIISYVINNWSTDGICANAINTIQHNIIAIIVNLIICIVALVSIFSINSFLKYKCTNDNKPKIKVVEAKRANKLSSEFLLAYILPMIAFDFSELKSVVLFTIYFGMLAFLCIRNNNVYTNILLEIKGYRMYSCNLERTVMGRIYLYNDCLVLSKNNLTINDNNFIEYWDFENYIYVDLG